MGKNPKFKGKCGGGPPPKSYRFTKKDAGAEAENDLET
jgi:hypothetical protein